MAWRLLLVFVLVSQVDLASAAAQPSAERVVEMLSSYEDGPSRIEWRALGSDTVGVLVALYQDDEQPTYVRLRAVAASAHFPIPATRTFLRAVASTPRQNDLFVRHAVLALGRAFGEAALGEISPYLEHRFPVVREAAARACVEIATEPARALVTARMGVEPDTNVLRTMRTLMAR